jgi:RNA polymerase sigma factor (sigma-70 family)
MALITPNLDPLVVAASNGDVDAYGRLVSATSGLVSSIALAIVRDVDLSRDVAQDVFLAAWRELRALRNPASFLPWLRQITRNRANHALRTRLRTREREAGLVDDRLMEAVADPRPGSDAALIAAEDARALADALESLPDEARETVLLYYREDQSAAQVAALLNVSEEAVRKRLSRARLALREALLAQAGDAARRTAPSAAFAAAIVSKVAAFGFPSATAVTTIAGAPKAGGAWTLAKAAAAVGGAALGAVGGVAGVFFGVRRLMLEARDDEERRALRRFAGGAALVVVAAAIMFQVSWTLDPEAWPQISVFAAFIVSLFALYQFWLPEIIARRLAAEMREDPARATARRTRERRIQLLGWTLGIASGAAGLIAGLWSAGLLTR